MKIEMSPVANSTLVDFEQAPPREKRRAALREVAVLFLFLFLRDSQRDEIPSGGSARVFALE